MITPGTLLRRKGKTTPVYRVLSKPGPKGSARVEPVDATGNVTGQPKYVAVSNFVPIKPPEPPPRANATDVLHYMRYEIPDLPASMFGVSVRFKCTLREADSVLSTLASIGEVIRVDVRGVTRYRLPPVKV